MSIDRHKLIASYKSISTAFLGKYYPRQMYAVTFEGVAADKICIHVFKQTIDYGLLHEVQSALGAAMPSSILLVELIDKVDDSVLLEWKVLLSKEGD